ncbi:trigger factor [uncultured Eubacterium sp.]|jgi:trigger factor|uniref:trigger factor n=1 Tax=uncultured Eubacterium sp. TaxID=165185 RepID=UPI002675524C|nr:trigger factor [uncultured Eubacterium sp.]
MSLQVEKLENNTAKLTIEVPAEEFDKAIQAAYQKNKNKFNVPGFRKGKVPYAMVEKMYGAGVFYEEAANELIPDAYANAAAESELEIVARPEINVTQIEKGKPFVFEAEVTLKPEIKLGKYKGVKVEAMDTTVTDEDVAAELDKVKEQNARLVAADDKAVEDGDQTTIDFEGFVDGVAFEGGKGEDYPLTIGSHSFIDTFEEQLIGKKVGEEVEVNVTFPEQYQAKELAGKPAMFKVTIKEIKVKEYPELDDDFAQDVSEFDTLDEYKADIKKNLEEKKAQEAEADKESKVIEAIVNDSEMDIPEKMIEAQSQQMVEEFAQNIAMQGISFDQYMQFTGTTVDQLTEQVKPQAEARVQSSLVLEAIVKAEKIEASDEEFDEEIKRMAERYQMEADKVNELLSDDDKKNIRADICARKAAKLVVEKAK